MSKVGVTWRVPRQYNAERLEELFQQIEEQINLLSEGKQVAYYGARTAAPTSGLWAKGDWVKNSTPIPGGYFGFVCTTSGEPGSWRGFGTIET